MTYCTPNSTRRDIDLTRPWRPEDTEKPEPQAPGQADLYRPDIIETIEEKIKELDSELRHPELAFEELHAHNTYTAFMEKHGFAVDRQFELATAWRATFEAGSGGRTIGVNSEMDALPGIGHACGHNLIGIAGVAVALAIKAALEKHNLSGKVVLLGTPAEESGGGKILLLQRGAYEGMDVCLMCHPAPGPIGCVSLSSSLAIERIIVEYHGKTAHAALSPWEGRNALDAAVLGYNNLSALRQQLRPTHRVQAIIEGKDWVPNIIPDYSKIICLVRAPTVQERGETIERVLSCFQAGALAAGCTIEIGRPGGVSDIRQNKALSDELAKIVLDRYGGVDYTWGISSASTDFGNVTYALPSLHPGFAIPTVIDGGNHTVQFAESASTIEAHNACLDVSKALAATAIRVLLDDEFFAEVKRTFAEQHQRKNKK